MKKDPIVGATSGDEKRARKLSVETGRREYGTVVACRRTGGRRDEREEYGGFGGGILSLLWNRC